MHWRRKWQPTPVFLPGESQGRRSLVGCRLWVTQSQTRLKRLSSSSSSSRLLCLWDSPGKSTGVGCHFLLQCRKVKSESEVAQLCRTLSDPVDCSLPGSSVCGILQAKILEWVAISFSSISLSPLFGGGSKNTGVGCHSLLQGDLPDSGIEPGSPTL